MDELALGIQRFYETHTGLCHAAILLAVFGGVARVAFWRDRDGLRVGGPLAAGLACLLTLALLGWASENGRGVAELGGLAGAVLVVAVLVMVWAFMRKATRA